MNIHYIDILVAKLATIKIYFIDSLCNMVLKGMIHGGQTDVGNWEA